MHQNKHAPNTNSHHLWISEDFLQEQHRYLTRDGCGQSWGRHLCVPRWGSEVIQQGSSTRKLSVPLCSLAQNLKYLLKKREVLTVTEDAQTTHRISKPLGIKQRRNLHITLEEKCPSSTHNGSGYRYWKGWSRANADPYALGTETAFEWVLIQFNNHNFLQTILNIVVVLGC